jgi:glucuronosyltransferase
LPQRIIWKWEDQSKFREDAEFIPPNVKTISWLPQQELLSHPNARLFISHGGLLSKQETVFHGVPAIFLPVWADQPINAQKAEDDGYAIRLCWDELTEEILYNAVQLILTNPRFCIDPSEVISISFKLIKKKLLIIYAIYLCNRYAQRMKKVSSLMHDQIDKPLNRAIYWIEYVIRHQGAPHLRNASRDLFLPQRGLMDVMVVILVFILSLAYVIFRICHFISSYRWKNLMIKSRKKDD